MASTKQATQKTVTVLNVYKFKEVARICFIVESSKGDTTYNTCFNGDAEHGNCTCPATSPKGCYHLNQLRPRAQAYFEARQPSEAEETPGLDAAEAHIATLKAQAASAEALREYKLEREAEYQKAQRENWKETAQFGNRTFSLMR